MFFAVLLSVFSLSCLLLSMPGKSAACEYSHFSFIRHDLFQHPTGQMKGPSVILCEVKENIPHVHTQKESSINNADVSSFCQPGGVLHTDNKSRAHKTETYTHTTHTCGGAFCWAQKDSTSLTLTFPEHTLTVIL